MVPSGHWNEVLIWGRFSTQKYLKSVHLKLTTCCSKIYPVVLSFNTHYRILSNPQSQKIPSESIPQSQKFSSKRIPQSQNFQAKNYPKLAHIPVLPKVKYPPRAIRMTISKTEQKIKEWRKLLPPFHHIFWIYGHLNQMNGLQTTAKEISLTKNLARENQKMTLPGFLWWEGLRMHPGWEPGCGRCWMGTRLESLQNVRDHCYIQITCLALFVSLNDSSIVSFFYENFVAGASAKI